jgi:hypothetical protein
MPGYQLLHLLGYQEYYPHLFIDLGLDMTPVTRMQHIQIDSKWNFHSAYVQHPLVKRRHFQDHVKKVLDQNNKLQKDKKKGQCMSPEWLDQQFRRQKWKQLLRLIRKNLTIMTYALSANGRDT